MLSVRHSRWSIVSTGSCQLAPRVSSIVNTRRAPPCFPKAYGIGPADATAADAALSFKCQIPQKIAVASIALHEDIGRRLSGWGNGRKDPRLRARRRVL